MKDKKIIIIIIVALAILLIGVGIFFLLPSSEENKDTKKERDYKTVVETVQDEIGKTSPTKSSFEPTAKEAGFSEVKCENASCTATNASYPDTEYEDAVTLAQDENKGKTLIVVLYFHKNDFNVDNVSKQLNTVSKNFFGTATTKDQLKAVIDGLNASSDNYYQTTHIAGKYTVEINMQNVVGTDYKLVKYLVLDTTLYNQYHNIG